MTDNNRGLTNTEYTSVTFDEIKQKILNRAQTYYPETYRDFSKTSFGSLMFDLVAMVGEQLNFYAQFVANEGFVDFARTGVGLTEGAKRAGVDLGETPPQGSVLLTLPIVVSDDQVTAESSCKYTVLKGTTCVGPNGAKVELQEDVTVLPTDKVIATEFSTDGSRPLTYLTEKVVPAIAGEIKSFVVEVGEYNQFLQIEIPDPTCTGVLEILDSEGNKYYEVGNLSLNTVGITIRDKDADTLKDIERFVDLPVPRRFRYFTENGRKMVEFGYGSEPTLKKTEHVAPAKDLLLNKYGRPHVVDRVITPGKYLRNDKYGVAPHNTTLTITYRSNNTDNSNIPVGGVDTVQSANIVFDDEATLGQQNMDFVRNNIGCTNTEPFNGLVRFQSTKEIAIACAAAQGAQGRAVTARDLVAMSYVMESKLGKIKKASVFRDTKGLRRNLKMYCISEDDEGKLQKSSTLLKQNLKTWINSVKMISDSIDIIDAEILNVGLHLDLTLRNREDINTAMPRIREFLYEELTLTTPEIGQAFSIGEVERILNLMPLVQRVNKVQVRVKNGENYASTRYDIAPNVAPDGSMIYMPENFIWEIKNKSDIIGVVK